jgi:hypothetical protein
VCTGLYGYAKLRPGVESGYRVRGACSPVLNLAAPEFTSLSPKISTAAAKIKPPARPAVSVAGAAIRGSYRN